LAIALANATRERKKMENKRTIEIERIIVDGEISHWEVKTSTDHQGTAPTFLDVWEMAYEFVTGDFGYLEHDGWSDFPEIEE
jgi:hypothetical protein